MDVQATASNRVVRLESSYPKEELRQEWSYQVPNFQFMQQYYPNWDGRKQFLKYDKVPAGLFWATRKEIEERYDIRFRVRTRCQSAVLRGEPGGRSDRAYQNECVDAMVRAVPHGGGLVLNATGSGKTYIAALFARRVKGSVLFVVDQLDLLEQAQAELERTVGEKVGYVGNQRYEPKRITVGTVQTLSRHAGDEEFQEWYDGVTYQIVDELHVQMNRRQFRVLEAVEPKACFGLTATLELKKKDVRVRAWAIAGPTCYEYPLHRGIREGVLTRGVVVQIQFPNSVDKDRRWQGQYTDSIVEHAERNALIAGLVRTAYRDKRYVITLVQRIAHLKDLSKRQKGIPHRVVYGEKEVTDRILAKKKFEKGRVRSLITNQVFKKGVDIKRVDVMVDAAAMQSKNDAIQKFGRGVRRHEDKDGLLYFDIGDYDPQPRKRRVWGQMKVQVHSFHKAAARRRRAFKQAGIPLKKIQYIEELEPEDYYREGRKFLEKVLGKDVQDETEKHRI